MVGSEAKHVQAKADAAVAQVSTLAKAGSTSLCSGIRWLCARVGEWWEGRQGLAGFNDQPTG